jgi:hypothetical protein
VGARATGREHCGSAFVVPNASPTTPTAARSSTQRHAAAGNAKCLRYRAVRVMFVKDVGAARTALGAGCRWFESGHPDQSDFAQLSVFGRKNFAGCKSVRGTEVAAALYSPARERQALPTSNCEGTCEPRRRRHSPAAHRSSRMCTMSESGCREHRPRTYRIQELERLFRERQMRTQLAELARFKAGYEAQRKKLAGAVDKPWTSETMLELAAVCVLALLIALVPHWGKLKADADLSIIIGAIVLGGVVVGGGGDGLLLGGEDLALAMVQSAHTPRSCTGSPKWSWRSGRECRDSCLRTSQT